MLGYVGVSVEYQCLFILFSFTVLLLSFIFVDNYSALFHWRLSCVSLMQLTNTAKLYSENEMLHLLLNKHSNNKW